MSETATPLKVIDLDLGARSLEITGERANALSSRLVDRLLEELLRAAQDRVRTVVIRGSARHFSAGFDLSDLANETDATLVHRFARIGLLLDTLDLAPFVTIAVIRGSAVGAGADLAAACDHRLAEPGATLRFPGSAFGVVLGVSRLASLVGEGEAMSLAASGRSVSSHEALDLGLLSAVLPDDQLNVAVDQIIRGVARPPAETVPKLVRASRGTRADSALADLVRSVGLHPGLHQRISAFMRDSVVAAKAAATQ